MNCKKKDNKDMVSPKESRIKLNKTETNKNKIVNTSFLDIYLLIN